MAGVDGAIGKTTADLVNAAACLAYIKGGVDGLNPSTATGVAPKSFKACYARTGHTG